jgi:hypothetical protein
MPPPEKGGKLKPDEIDILTKWVSNGAIDPRIGNHQLGGMSKQDAKTWWSYQPIKATEKAASSELIDELIEQRLKSVGLQTTPKASRRELIRRATYDLTGLPPTYQEVLEFQNDGSPDAFLKVINRLLDSKEYGEHWGRHWLDVIRYADTAGENSDRPLPHAWRFRNWVIESVGQDLPFDSFAKLQIAGDLAPPGTSIQDKNNGIVATGYLAVARRYGHNINKDIHLMYEDVIDNVGKAFLGLTIGCPAVTTINTTPLQRKIITRGTESSVAPNSRFQVVSQFLTRAT